LASAQQRLSWVIQIAEHYENVEVSDIEVLSQKKMPTYKTLCALKLRYNFTQKPYLIIGADNLSSLPSWYQYDALSKEVNFVIAKRNDLAIATKYKVLDVNVDICSSDLRTSMQRNMVPHYLENVIVKTYKEYNEKS